MIVFISISHGGKFTFVYIYFYNNYYVQYAIHKIEIE
jgi:hypothetical protein